MASNQPSDADQPDVDTQSESVSRERTLTEKGKDYKVAQYESKFKAAISSWRRRSNSIKVLLADSEDAQVIRQERDLLQSCLNDLNTVLQDLETLKGDCTWEFLKLDDIETENQNIMQSISDFLRELQSAKFDTRSQVSGSSRASSKASNSSKLSDIATKRAALKAELKFIDLESKCKADLQKIQTLKKLEMAEAEFNALEALTEPTNVTGNLNLPECDKSKMVKDFISSHSSCPVEVKQESHTLSLPRTKVPGVTISEEVLSPSVANSSGSFVSVSTNMNSPIMSTLSSQPVSVVYTAGISQHSSVNMPSISPHVNFTLPQTNTGTQNHVSEFIGSNHSDSNKYGKELKEVTKALAEQVNLSRLPSPEPGVFSGDPLSYPSWRSAFQTLIEQRDIPRSERIHYLKRYVSGPVREVIDGFLMLSSDEAFDEAKKLLDKRYGDPFVIANAFRDKLDKWPKLAPRDGKGLQKFSDFLNQCYIATRSIDSLAVLDDSRENRKLLAKVPDWIVNKWNRLVYQWKEDKGLFPPFKVFSEFLTKESSIACDPVTSIQSLKPEGSTVDKRIGSQNKLEKFQTRSSFAVNIEEDISQNDSSSDTLVCAFCNMRHDLDSCSGFLSGSLEERKNFIRQKGLCFGCLRTGHISRKCRQRKPCQICCKLHPTSLHGDRGGSESATSRTSGYQTQVQTPPSRNNANSGVAFLNQSGAKSKCSAIVPVYISHSDDPNRERLVYALLDSQSDTTFILEDTYRSLGLSGTPVKLSLSTMLAEDRLISCQKVKGLSVRGFDSNHRVSLPDAYTRNVMPANRSHVPTPEVARAWSHLDCIAPNLLPLNPCEIGLLIGYNCSEALMPQEIIPPQGEGPYGQRTVLGWSIVGIVQHGEEEEDSIGLSHRIVAREVPSELSVSENSSEHLVLFSLKTSVKEVVGADVVKLLERDFCDNASNGAPLSQDDTRFLSILNEGIHVSNGKYEMPLPFRYPNPVLPNNRTAALSRLKSLQKRLQTNELFRTHYTTFMTDLIKKGHAEKVVEQGPEDKTVWYIPHHGVYHPQKPGKIRVVFDCSASFQGHSLNQVLLQGPDLTNKLVGVLSRFRKEPIGFMCDIEQMFYQFKVTPDCQDYLRFLWWDSNDFSSEPNDYRMSVHLFGATSSPGCANFGLKRLAKDHESTFGSDVSDFIHHDFYVDDGVKSLATVTEAIDLIDRTRSMCMEAGLRLHKFVSNSNLVTQSVPPEERAKGVKTIDIAGDKAPVERALGISWCIESDTFQFRIVLKDRPLTRRGILSAVSCLYDPLGLIAPVVLQGKQILQLLCADKADWDDPLPESLRTKWQQWREGLEDLSSLNISRCVKPKVFGETSRVELHHFSDASSIGYGQCSYVRLVSKDGEIHCSLLMGKARVVPLKPITIPRLELVAALLSVKIGSLLQCESGYENPEHFYWTDSKVVLGYIGNESRRFHVFVANRVQQIRDHSEPSQWHYVNSPDNPADIASRGIQAKELVNCRMWFNGPTFLWQQDLQFEPCETVSIDPQDPEVKRSQCFFSEQNPKQVFATMLERLQYFSSWQHARRAVALCLRLKTKLQQRLVKKPKTVLPKVQLPSQYLSLTVEELQRAEEAICRLAQLDSFPDEMKSFKSCGVYETPSDRKEVTRRHTVLRSSSKLCKLDPFIDPSSILRVGGRLKNSSVPSEQKHPIVMPKKGHMTELLIRHLHEKCNHQGRGITTNEIRQNGFWVIGCSGVVSTLLSKCTVCRRLRATTQVQKMSELPSDRLEPTPPFTYCAVDLFGPFLVKEGRKELKRYGVLFTCMACRAIHIETANSLETDAFISALRRLIAIRGPLRQLRSDRGTNFVGAENELRKAISELDESQIHNFLLQQNCDYIPFRMNVPSASHMGGVWERQIRSTRNVLAFLLRNHGSQLDDESLRTFMHEAAAIVNCRPLTVETLNDPLSVTPLTPNQLLTLKSKVVLPPPGNFQKEDVYSRKRWRRTQYLVDQFWVRWKVEFLQNLQVRNKWIQPKRNMSVGDIVIVKDDNLPRNQWNLGRLIDSTTDDDGLVRKVKIEMGDSSLDNKGKRTGSLTVLERPIHKVVLLHETQEVPVGEP